VYSAQGPEDGKNSDEAKANPKVKNKQEQLVQGLKKGGVDKATAQRILKVWEQTGASSPDELRKLLVNRSLKAAGLVGFQTLLDAGASWGAFSTAQALSVGPPFFGKIAVEYLAYFLGLYFATSVFLDLFTLGAIAFSGVQYGSNSEAFLNAVRQVAGPQSGLNVVNKAQQAVNTAKVVNALNQINSILKERSQTEGDTSDTLRNLQAFLTLQKAEERGFKPESFGLSPDEAAVIASIFSKYDLNDDMVLQRDEVARLFQGEGLDLSDAEVKQAIELLDKNNDGLIDLEEFTSWWQNSVSDEAKAKIEEQSTEKSTV
jgi:Ca2+-binding EF-hand superfamily protein